MNEQEKRIQMDKICLTFLEGQDSAAFKKAKAEFKKVKHLHINTSLRKQKLKNLIFAQLKEYIQKILPELTEKQVDEFIRDLKSQEVLGKYNQEKINDCIVLLALAINFHLARRYDKMAKFEDRRKITMIIKHIEKAQTVLGKIIYSKQDIGVGIDLIDNDWREKVKKSAYKELSVVLDNLKKYQEMLAILTPSSKGRQPAYTDNLAFLMAEIFNDMFGQPTQTKDGPFYNVVKIVRKSTGLDWEYPDKTVAAAIKTLKYIKKQKKGQTCGPDVHFSGLSTLDWTEST